MPRRPRHAQGGLVYHVLNRGVARMALFEDGDDYAAFERILEETLDRLPVPLLSYYLMPNHWHLVLQPQGDGDLSEFMRLLTVTHTQRWHAHRRSAGTGPVYQGRFKSFPVQDDAHFLAVARYVERNALRAGLVERAEGWRWSSLWRWKFGDADQRAMLADWPVARPRNWVWRVNQPESEAELEALRRSVRRGRPYGDEDWTRQTAARLDLQSTLRPRGRPRKEDGS